MSLNQRKNCHSEEREGGDGKYCLRTKRAGNDVQSFFWKHSGGTFKECAINNFVPQQKYMYCSTGCPKSSGQFHGVQKVKLPPIFRTASLMPWASCFYPVSPQFSLFSFFLRRNCALRFSICQLIFSFFSNRPRKRSQFFGHRVFYLISSVSYFSGAAFLTCNSVFRWMKKQDTNRAPKKLGTASKKLGTPEVSPTFWTPRF